MKTGNKLSRKINHLVQQEEKEFTSCSEPKNGLSEMNSNYKREEVVHLLLSYFRNKANAAQQKELQEWVNGHEKHLELFQRLQDSEYVKKELTEYQRYDSQKEWKTLSTHFTKPHRQVFSFLRTYVAAAILLFSAGTTAWFFLLHQTPTIQNIQTIQYGSSKAVLFLESGKTLELVTRQDTFYKEVKGENFVNDGRKLIYTEIEEKKTVGWHTLKVPRGGEFVLKLADGTVVTLNADSKIYYPSQFIEGERKVVLEGEAFFEVARDSLRPFIVKTDGMNVQVLGTHFNLKAYPDEDEQTTLISGSVEVSIDKQQALLHPGEQATHIGGELKVEEVDLKPYIAWKHERFIFKNEPLERVLKKLERWYDIEVIIQHPKLKEKRFTGNLPKYENIGHILKILSLTTNIHFELKNRTLVVLLE